MAPKGKKCPPKALIFSENEKQALENDNDEATHDQDEEDDEFTLDDVLRLGGTKADYVMLVGLDDNNELINGGKKGAIDDLEEGELGEFITKLGICAYADQQVIKGDDEDEQEEMVGEPDEEDKKKAPLKAHQQVIKGDDEDEQEELVGEHDEKKSKKKVPLNAEYSNASADKQETEAKKKNKEVQKTARAGKKAKQKEASLFEFYPRQTLLLRPGGKWYDIDYSSEMNASPQDESLVSQYKALAQKLFEAEVEFYKTKKSLQKGANTAWMKSVVSTGTLADRMAAMTVLIQDAPVHSVEHIESLVTLVRKKGSRRQGLMALDTIKELLLSDLLPESRKLRAFIQRPFNELEERASGNRDARDRRLVLWYFEHQLKLLVADFVVALDALSHDTLLAIKTKALTTAHELLCNRPEQERALLVHVVNKLGDPEYKVASKASYLLETLLHKHPNMKVVVCTEVERLMFRPNISAKAQYYAACFLNQVMLSHEEADLATQLITVYFTFFRICVRKKDVGTKMLGALLTGVNRAYPYTQAGDETVREQLDTLFKVVHMVKFSTAMQALMLLFQVMDSQQTVSDRYYVALYRKLLDPGLSVCSRQSMFLNLLYKSLKADIVLRRIKAFLKRLLQVSCEQSPAFACGALFLVSEVMKSKPGLKLLLHEAGDGEEEKFQDLKGEEEDEEDDEERFVDADKIEEGQCNQPEQPKPTASWVHHQNLEGSKKADIYDPTHRNPLYCGADHSTLWELQKLSLHFHPSVALFAKTIIQGAHIQYTGDPLQDFILIRFLDRFVFRNPKQVKGKQNTEATVMQPKQKQSMNNIRALPVNCVQYLAKKESQIPVDEVFFYRFFKKREGQIRRSRAATDNESVEDIDDDEFDRMLNAFESDNYFTEFKDEDLDFAGNVKSKSKKGKKTELSDSDLDSDDNLDDEEVSLGSIGEEDFGDELEEEGGAFMDPKGEDDDEVPELEEDIDNEAMDDTDEDLEDESEVSNGPRKGKRKSTEYLDFSQPSGLKPGKKKKKGKMHDAAVFASAEEFGDLLDENVGTQVDSTGLNALANRDKASVKQLKWETKREDWIQGRDVSTLRRKKAMFNKRKQFRNAGRGKKTTGRRK
ncbi:CCAAT/enhancer-binding protein zeta [Electrophorus electricus]|uniref:CCAAT/enhancer-binding protein zeta n=1 Tax=Electrophorus electricus TaxID=8005 RepID=A0A4W4F543_ELEEL|nr:CCAAT/enhancer-binding protein zeta [Electrophorus electricus]